MSLPEKEEMTPTRWEAVQEAVADASELSGPDLAQFLAALKRTDPALCAEVQSLLAAGEDMGNFLSVPFFGTDNQLSGALREAGLMIGRNIGPYRILRELGRGGMGAVYMAERADQQYEKRVAIKLLSHGVQSEETMRRFLAERQILAAFDHPNIARLLDGGTTESGLPYLVMEHIEGLPIDAYCREHALDTNARLRLFQRVCDAVAHAHRHLIVHRDLKPGNILVTPDGIPKLLDFGIAKPLDATADVTRDARPMTPAYASPEQARGGHITTVSDVYSLGVVLYQLLCDQRPHRLEDCSLEDATRIICEQLPLPPSAHLPARDFSTELDDIVLMALRKEPERRYESVNELSQDLDQYLTGRPVKARPDTVGYRAAKFARRNRRALVAAAAGLLFLLCTMFVLAVNQYRLKRALDEIRISQQKTEEALLQARRATALAEAEGRRKEEAQQQNIATMAMLRTQYARAERGFEELWKLSNTILFKLEDEIKTLPGSMRARETMIKLSVEAYSVLAREAQGRPNLQREMALAHRRLGDLQGNSPAGDQGNPAAAVPSYRKALGLLERQARRNPADPTSRRDLATSYILLGKSFEAMSKTADALKTYRRALQILETPPAIVPDDAQAKLERMSLHNRIGTLLRNSGKTTEAGRHLRNEETIFESLLNESGLTPFEAADVLSENSLRLDDQFILPQNRPKATETYRKLLALAEKRSAATPGFIDRSMGWLHLSLGRVLASGGHHDDARNHYQAATDIFRKLTETDPENARDLRSLSNGLRGIGEMLYVGRHEKESLPYYLQSMAIDESMLKKNPSYAPTRVSLAHGYKRIAQLQSENGKLNEALQAYGKAFAIHEDFVRQEPGNLKSQANLAQLYFDLGNTYRWNDNFTHALTSFGKGLAITEGIFAKDPLFETNRDSLHFLIGVTLARLGDYAGAIEHHRRYIDIRNADVARNPENKNKRDRLAASYLDTSRLYANLARDEKLPIEKRIDYWREASSHLKRRIEAFQALGNYHPLSEDKLKKIEESKREIARFDAEIARLRQASGGR